MTIGNLSTVATWIAGLTYTGIKVIDLSAIPDSVNPQDAPLLMPDAPYMSNFVFTRLSFRDQVYNRKLMCEYVLHYRLYHSVISEGVTWHEQLKALHDAWTTIVNVIVVNETPNGAYDIRPQGTPTFGAYKHAVTGASFNGCQFDLWIQEFS